MATYIKDFGWTILVVLLYLVDTCVCGEYCGYHTSGGYYSQSYCSGYCCNNDYDNCCTSWGWIAGAVVGAIVLLSIVGVIVFMICAKLKAKKNRTVHVGMQQTGAQQQTMGYNAYSFNKPPNRRAAAPPAYGQYPAPPPPYTESFNNGGGPYGAYPPPPPYSGPMTSSQPMPGYSGMQTTSLNTGDAAYPPPPAVS